MIIFIYGKEGDIVRFEFIRKEKLEDPKVLKNDIAIAIGLSHSEFSLAMTEDGAFYIETTRDLTTSEENSLKTFFENRLGLGCKKY